MSTSEFEVADRTQGLGINGVRLASVSRVPVGSRTFRTPPTPSKDIFANPMSTSRSVQSPPTSPSPYFIHPPSVTVSPQTPASAKPFLSPLPRNSTHGFAGHGLEITPELGEENDIQNDKKKSYADSLNEAFEGQDTEFGDGSREMGVSTQIGSDENGNWNADHIDGCPPKHDIHSSRKSWLSISILILSVFSTIFSGIYLVIALVQPRYGRNIHTGGKMSPATASTLFALFAKTIELSFVTVFITFLGQVLSRRSLVKASRGITIAELTMRTWVIQPGFMITHWQTLQHAGITILGVITLTAAFVAMFYTTASDALVSPHLKFGNWEKRLIYGVVKTSYANPDYIANSCQTPITKEMDPLAAGTTCLSVLHAGQAQRNQITFLDAWTQIGVKGESASPDLALRPQAPATLFENTTVAGSWILTQTSNITLAYAKYNRVINNISMAMPHSGVVAATREARNAILQPEDLDGVGEYRIKASVVSPAVNVLCVNMNEAELAPLVYVTWPYANTTDSPEKPGQVIARPGYQDGIRPVSGSTFLNSTVVDDIFEWGPNYNRQPPVFPIFPLEYNSLVNSSVPLNYTDSNYLLIKAPNTTTPDYTLCQIRSFISPACSTQYTVSTKSGARLWSHCEDPFDSSAYHRSVEDPPIVRISDWRNVGSEWLNAIALGTGISNGNAASARLISQLISATTTSGGIPKLNPLMPSIAESIAVMAGSTLLLSTTDSTFYHFWNYTATELKGTQLAFNASISSQEFTSGPTQNWQSMFYVVLLLVFCTNVFCLIYFFVRSGLVTDYTEPQNLFVLAVNSPPSRRLNGSCGAGPEKEQLDVDWHVSQAGESGHFFIKENGNKQETGESMFSLRRRSDVGVKELKNMSSYSKLSNRRRTFL